MSHRRRSLLRRAVGDVSYVSASALAVAYIVLWGCQWGAVRSAYAPPSVPVTQASLTGEGTGTTEVGVSVLPALPTAGGAVWLSHEFDDHYQLFGGVGVGGGLLNVSTTPFGGLRLLFDPTDSLRIGLELSAYLEAGSSFGGLLTESNGLYLQPGAGLSMPLGWRFLNTEVMDLELAFSLYTNPGVAVGPAWGKYPAFDFNNPERVGIVRLPVGAAIQWESLRAFVELGGQGAGATGARFVLLPIPFPYLAAGASFAF